MSAKHTSGLVVRLRNGGQPDLADMAQGLLQALVNLRSIVPTNCWNDESMEARILDEVDAAIAKAEAA